jgi:outer membrane lipoprotein-sorting protein
MRKFSVTVSLALVGIIGLQAAAPEDPKQIMEKSQAAMTLAGSESVASLFINDGKGNQRVRKFSSAQKAVANQAVTKMVMRFLEPADVKGTGILTFDYENKDDEMWLYMPALRKIRRIVSSEKTKNFMGSEFTNSDITKPAIEEYTYKLIGTESMGNVECWKMEMTPATKEIAAEYGYSKKIGWFGKADYVARKTEFYDQEGKLLKVMNTEKVQLLDEKNGKYQPVDITMENRQNGRSSRFLIEKVIFNPKVKDEYFTTDYLEK